MIILCNNNLQFILLVIFVFTFLVLYVILTVINILDGRVARKEICMKKIVKFLLTFVLCLSMSINALAAPVSLPAQKSNEIINEIKQEMKEINQYLQNNLEPMELKNQEIKYEIPLSNGETAEYSIKLTKRSSDFYATILDAKVGEWYFDSTLKLANHGSVKTRTTVNITKVPTSSGSTPKFTAYDGKVTAIPSQYVSVDTTFAETKCVSPDLKYTTTGYVGFNVAGIPANFYFTQTIAIVDNMENYNKLQCSLVGEF